MFKKITQIEEKSDFAGMAIVVVDFVVLLKVVVVCSVVVVIIVVILVVVVVVVPLEYRFVTNIIPSIGISCGWKM